MTTLTLALTTLKWICALVLILIAAAVYLEWRMSWREYINGTETRCNWAKQYPEDYDD